VAQDLL